MDLFLTHIIPLLPPGSADLHTIPLAPAYTPVITRMEKVVKNAKQWTPDYIATLQGCESTDWNNFLPSSSNIIEQVDTVSSHITFFVDNIIPTKKVTIFPNNKPWITKELKEILNK